MVKWKIRRSDAFFKHVKKYKANKELLSQLDKKNKILKDGPESIGKELCGNLHGFKSTRLAKNYRLIFSIDKENKVVYLSAIDHRKDVY